MFNHWINSFISRFFVALAFVAMFGISAAYANVCFLPNMECADGNDIYGLGGSDKEICPSIYNLSSKKEGPGWKNCDECGGLFYCPKKSCISPDYVAGKTCDTAIELKICDGYSGDDECCKCQNRSQACIDDGYKYTKQAHNSCTDVCPHDNNYYKVCTCLNYELTSTQATDKCVVYDECIIRDENLQHETKYFKEIGSNRICNINGTLVPQTNDMVSDDDHYSCTYSCTEQCENDGQGMKYYLCSQKEAEVTEKVCFANENSLYNYLKPGINGYRAGRPSYERENFYCYEHNTNGTTNVTTKGSTEQVPAIWYSGTSPTDFEEIKYTESGYMDKYSYEGFIPKSTIAIKTLDNDSAKWGSYAGKTVYMYEEWENDTYFKEKCKGKNGSELIDCVGGVFSEPTEITKSTGGAMTARIADFNFRQIDNLGGDTRNIYVRVKTYAARPPVHPQAYGRGVGSSSSGETLSDAIGDMRFVITGSFYKEKLGTKLNFKPLQTPTINDNRWWDTNHSWVWDGSFSNEEDEKALAHWPDWEPSLTDTVWRASVSENYAGKIEIVPLLHEVAKDLDYGDCMNCYHQTYGGYVLTDEEGNVLHAGDNDNGYYLDKDCDNSNTCLLSYGVNSKSEDIFIDDILYLHPYVNINVGVTGVEYTANNSSTNALNAFRSYLNNSYVVYASTSRQLSSPIELHGTYTMKYRTNHNDNNHQHWYQISGDEKSGLFRSCADDNYDVSSQYLDVDIRDTNEHSTFEQTCAPNFATGHSIAYLYGGNTRYKIGNSWVDKDGGYHSGGFIDLGSESCEYENGPSFSWGPMLCMEYTFLSHYNVQIVGHIDWLKTASGRKVTSGEMADDGVIYNFTTDEFETYFDYY